MAGKEFKFIHISDLHIGREITKKYSFLDPDQEIRVRRSPIKVLDNLVALAEEEQPDFILLAGDTFDDDMPTSDNYFKKFKTCILVFIKDPNLKSVTATLKDYENRKYYY